MAVTGGVLIILGKRKDPTAHTQPCCTEPQPVPPVTCIIPASLFAASVKLVLVELLLAGTETRWR
jgi:hypothetical protein